MLPRYKPTYLYKEIFEAFNQAISGDDPISALRSALADYYHVKHIFLFSKAREALSALLLAYNNPGDVLIPAYNCIAVPEAIKLSGYQPLFIDIDLKTLNFQLDELENKITSKSKVILITHQFGIPAEIDLLLELCKKHQLLIIEDAAPAFGAGYHGQLAGTFGNAAILSFDKTKVLSGMGGGALLTNDDELASRVQSRTSRLLRPRSIIVDFMESLVYFASTHRQLYNFALFLYRLVRKESLYEIAALQNNIASYPRKLSKFQAGIILVQFGRVNQILERKRKIADYYLNQLASDPRFTLPSIPVMSSPSWSQFPILTDDKEKIFWKMRNLGIDLSWNYKYSCPESYGLGGFPNSLAAAKSVLGLPIYPALDESACAEICEKLSR